MGVRLEALSKISLILVLSLGLTGCTVIFQKGRRTDVEKIAKLQGEVDELEKAKQELEDRLRREIADKQVKVERSDRGLVITFVAEVLFDSGKAHLRKEAFETLDKVGTIINTTVKDLSIGVEGHTDNIPIKYSGWKSNWELSSGRALGVLHYLVDNLDVNPIRLSATGYGEYHPIASNDTKEGRQTNRRVEIVILPDVTKKK